VSQHSAAAILGLLLLAPAAPVAAQQPPDLPQALARVELHETVTILDTDGRRLVGRLGQVSSSGLTLVQRGQATSVPLQRVARITISDRRRNGAATGALIGAAIGAAGGFAVNAICANEGGECFGIVLALTGAGAVTGRMAWPVLDISSTSARPTVSSCPPWGHSRSASSKGETGRRASHRSSVAASGSG
jgi:hypothetical protein